MASRPSILAGPWSINDEPLNLYDCRSGFSSPRVFPHFYTFFVTSDCPGTWFLLVCVFFFSANREFSHQNSRTFRCSKMFHQSHFLFILFFFAGLHVGLARFCFCFHACLIWPRTNQRFIDKILVSWFEYFTSESFQHAFSNRFWCGFPGTNFQRSDAPIRLTIRRGWVWRKKKKWRGIERASPTGHTIYFMTPNSLGTRGVVPAIPALIISCVILGHSRSNCQEVVCSLRDGKGETQSQATTLFHDVWWVALAVKIFIRRAVRFWGSELADDGTWAGLRAIILFIHHCTFTCLCDSFVMRYLQYLWICIKFGMNKRLRASIIEGSKDFSIWIFRATFIFSKSVFLATWRRTEIFFFDVTGYFF